MIRRLLVAASAALLVLAMVGVVSAAIPNSSTKVYVACMDRYGKIRLIDHQAGARCLSSEKTLTWNQRGPTGLTGPMGSPGPSGEPGVEGPQGVPGVSGYEVVTVDDTMALNVASGTTTAECPTGKVPIGGGYDLSDLFAKNVNAKWENFVGASYPSSSGWVVKWWHNMDTLIVNFRVYAICASAE